MATTEARSDTRPTLALEHPVAGLHYALPWRERSAYDKATTQSLREQVAEVLSLDAPALDERLAEALAARRTLADRLPIEATALQLAQLHAQAGDPEAAARAARILYRLAQGADELAAPEVTFRLPLNAMPTACVVAYDLLAPHEEAWEALPPDARATVAHWLARSARSFVALMRDGRITNLVPYAIRAGLGTALALDDADLLRDYFHLIDRMYEPQHYYAEGLWGEGTISYHDQVVGNIDAALQLLAKAEHEGRIARALGQPLEPEALAQRWPMRPRTQQIQRRFRYPDGRYVTVHDAHWQPPGKPVQPEHTHNLELGDFGHFALTHGQAQQAVQVHLHNCPLAGGSPFGGGHVHADRLSLILYAGGRELLPDAGYAFQTANHRYYHMSVRGHNTAFAWSPDAEPYAQFRDQPVRPALLAYDPGRVSEGRVQLVAAAAPGPEGMGVQTRQRWLALIAVDEQRSYALDLFRLRGGRVHQWFLRQTEEESAALDCSAALTPHPGQSVAQLVAGSVADRDFLGDYLDLMRDPRTAAGDQPTRFTWTGEQTGLAVRGYLNGVPASELIFAQAPRLRPTEQKPAWKDRFLGWHLTRSRRVEPEQLTTFGAVYDAVLPGRPAVIRSVQWLSPQPRDDAAVAVRVTLADGTQDLLYASDDEVVRAVALEPGAEPVTLAGRFAAVRWRDGRAVWGYVWGAGVVEAGALRVAGAPAVEAAVEAVEREPAQGGVLRVDAALSPEVARPGGWLSLILGDGTSRGLRIVEASAGERGGRVRVHDDPGLVLTPEGAQRVYHPARHVPGPVRVRIERPAFETLGGTPPGPGR